MHRLIRRPRRKSGQTLVLIGICALLLALGALYVLSLGTLLRNKTKAQATADAAAWSLAVAEARAFNHFSVTNRAILANYVAMMAVAGYQSYLSYYDEHTYQTWDAWSSGIPAQLSAYISCCSDWVSRTCTYTYSCNCSSCCGDNGCHSCDCDTCSYDYDCSYCRTYCHSDPCRNSAGNAISVANTIAPYFQAEHDRVHRLLHDPSYNSDFQIDSQFNLTEEQLIGQASSIHHDQLNVWNDLQRLVQGQGLALSVARMTDPSITGPVYGGAGPSWQELDRAVMVSPYVPYRDVFFQTLMATRDPTFVSARDAGGYTAGRAWSDVIRNAMNAGSALGRGTPSHRDEEAGAAKPLANTSGWDIKAAVQRNTHAYAGATGGWGGSLGMGAEDHGVSRNALAFSCSTVTADYSGDVEVWADPHQLHDEGFHSWGAHPGVRERAPNAPGGWGASYLTCKHDLGGCQAPTTPGGSWRCGIFAGWMRFNVRPTDEDPFNGQPHTYALLAVPANAFNPWEISATVDALPGAQGASQASFSTRTQPVEAMSHALVYYHPPRDDSQSWREPPSFFNPFWRAKLQPLTAQRALRVLAATGPDMAGTFQAQHPVGSAQQQVEDQLNSDARAILAAPHADSLVH